MKNIINIGKNSRKAFRSLSHVHHDKIKKVLKDYIFLIEKNKLKIIKENLKDIKQLKRRNLLDRLKLDDKRINGIVNSIKEIRKFKNLSVKLDQWTEKNNNINKTTSIVRIIYDIAKCNC